MKKLIIAIIVVLIASNSVLADSWLDNWTINGVPAKRFKNADVKDYAEIVLGIGAAIGVHWLSHVAYNSIEGISWHQDGLSEIIDEPITAQHARNFARAGMVGQLIAGSIVKFTDLDDSMFAVGLHTWNFLEISTYTLIHKTEGDLVFLKENGGNSTGEYALYTTWAAANMFKWFPDK